jgi:BolA protein
MTIAPDPSQALSTTPSTGLSTAPRPAVETTIESKVVAALRPVHLELLNESHMHAGPRTDSHFKLVAVAAAFEGLSKVKRHQLVYRLLGEELGGPVHALALHLYSPAEWETQVVPASPLCAGANKS